MKKQLLPLLLLLAVPFFLFSKTLENNNNDFASLAGTMDLNPVTVCGGGSIMPAHNNDEVLDPGDVLAFVIHDEQGPFLGNILALEFGANPTFEMGTNMNFNTTYYLSAIAGEDLGGGTINIADPELSVAMGTPIVFSQASSVQLNESICFGDVYTVGGQTFSMSGIYNITLTSAQGCDSIIDLNLSVIDVSANGFAEPITCFNFSTFLIGFTAYNGPGQVIYSWTGNGLQQPLMGQQVEVFWGGVYMLNVAVIENNTICTTTSEVFVDEQTMVPWFVIEGNTSVCGGGSTVLQVLHNMNCPIFQWSGPNGFSSTAEEILISESGTYNVEVTDCFSGCSEVSSITVDIFNELEIGPDIFLDCNTTATIIQPQIVNTAAGVQYQWTTVNGNIVAGGNTTTPTVDASGTYLLQVTDTNNGCVAEDEVQVVSFAASADAGQNMTLDCNNSLATLGGNNTNTNPNNSFDWTDAFGNVISTDPITTVSAGGVYVLQITDNATGCTATDEVVVVENYEIPFVFAQVSGPLNCYNTSVILSGGGSTTGVNFYYQWIDPSGNVVGTGISTTVSVPGNYTLEITNTENGCSSSGSIFCGYSTTSPTVEIVPNNPVLNCFNGYTATLVPTVTGTSDIEYFWSGPNGFTSTNNEITITGQGAAGLYILEVVDVANGCSETLDVEVIAEGSNFDIVTTDADCDMANGTASLTNIPANHTFTWSNFETTQTITDLAQGWYSVTVTDPSSTCNQHENFYIDEDISCKVVIGGYVVKDLNQSCTYDSAMEGVEAVMIKLEPLGIFTYTNADGYYEFVVDNGDYTVEYITNTAVDLICPLPSTYSISLNSSGTSSLNNHFFVEGKIYDLCLSKSIGSPRPNRNQFNCVMACNYSEDVQNAVVTFTHDPIFAEVTPLPNISPINNTAFDYTYDAATYTFTWTLNNLQPGDCRKIMFYMKVPITANIGDDIMGSAKVGPIAGDINPTNNCLDWTLPVRNSYDPNDKRNMVGETPWGGGIEMDDETMEYAIRFQNVGNDTAFTVVVRDTIDTDHLDVTSIRDVIASHEYSLEFEGHNVLIFRFEDIMLVDSFTNEPGSNGWVNFNIDRLPGQNFGTEIKNQAAIYFDYNAPIITNEVLNTIESHFFDVAGFIHTDDGEEVENVNVAVSGDMIMNTTSDANGNILLEQIQSGSELHFDFEKNINLLNGVTTFDIVLIHQHIIGTQLIDSPYRMIAADANNSNHITTHDIVILKSAILHLTDEFPNNTSWRFVDGDFSFTDSTNPFLDDFPERVSILNLEDNRMLDVVGIKVGDVNGSASPDLFTHADDRGLDRNVSLVVENEVVRVGEKVLIPFLANDFSRLQAFQFTLAFAKEKLKFEGFEKGVLQNMTANDFYFSPTENGKVTFAYASPEVQNFKIGEPLFYLKFKVLENTNFKEILNITKNPTDAIAYDEFGKAYNIALAFSNNIRKTNLQVYPNPANNHLFLDFSIEKESEVTLEIFNSFGQQERVVFENKKYNKGTFKHQVDLDGLSSGTYFIYLKTKEENLIKRFVKI